MNPKTADAIRDMTLQARQLLMDEVSENLEGTFGLIPSGQFRPAKQYPALAELPEAAETRDHLETLLAEEDKAGMKPKEAREKLVKEAAFTWLNRFVAFKMMETRKLLRQTVTKGPDSNGFKMWLTEPGNDAHLADYERGDLPQDRYGEGPRQRAYRHFLLAQCAHLAREIRVLFDPDNLASRLCPRPKALHELIDMLNAEALEGAWKQGNEETIGWVYKSFIEKEKKEVFNRLYKQKLKIRAEDIPAATQIFTPRWIVRCLVENTLGRMWLQMHPDSDLAQRLEFLVTSEDSCPAAPLKPVREIRLLDPACGTMHFGLVAFDWLVDMYREEMERAGEPGWPKEPSVAEKADIPASILANNLHGIDIDLRAVQLASLTLFLRAKTLNPKATLTESRLACADIHMLDGDRLKQFLEQAGLDARPIYGRVLTALQERLGDSEQLGSLLRLEEEIRDLIEKERARFEREDEKPFFPGWSKEQFETEAGRREFWEILEVQIGQALDAFARDQAESGQDYSFFAGETTKGLRLLELMAERYDVVLTNPPYMTSRNMNAVLKQYLQKKYPVTKSDLYAAFIQRCAEWLAEGGRLGMITQQSFMFISSYEKLRSFLRDRVAIETMPHVGPRAFEEVTGEKVNTTLLVFRREEDEKTRDDSVGTYFRLVKEPDAEAKRQRFEEAVARLRAGQDDPAIFCYRQGDFDAIPGSPWVYWIAPGIKNVFLSLEKLGDLAPICIGMRTGDNARFLYYWWEVGADNIARGCPDASAAKHSERRWFPYMKGGSFRRWYGNQDYIVEWWNNGHVIKENTKLNYPYLGDNLGWKISNEQYYFRRGVTWSDLTSGRFSARLSPGGFIFDVKGSSAFPDDIPLVMGLLNSSFAYYALNLLNPTVSFQVGDLARLPIPNESSDSLNALVDRAIELAKFDSAHDEKTYDFIAPPCWPDGPREVAERRARLAEIEHQIDEEVYRLYGISEEDRRAIEAELGEPSVAENDDVEDSSSTGGEDSDATLEASITLRELACQWMKLPRGCTGSSRQPRNSCLCW